jgi:outer membrane lipoprotein-sorting protein
MPRWINIALLMLAIALPAVQHASAQGTGSQTTPSATDIIRRADANMRGEYSTAELSMTIVRPRWTRELSLKSWSRGTEYSLILITAPARDQGTAFLKRDQEIWNWQPAIDRSIKLPPSMMMQSWMGSDFTNDDLIRESSVVTDYTHERLGTDKVEGRDCYRIALHPKPEAAVVWGKVLAWIDQTDYMQLKAEFYDEDGYLVQTMLGSDIRDWGGRKLPARLEVIPADKPGHKTVVQYRQLDFKTPVQESFFTLQNLKSVR